MSFLLPILLLSSVLMFQNCGINLEQFGKSADSTSSSTIDGVDYWSIGKPIPLNAQVDTIATGHGFTEGPIWVPSMNSLIYTDQSNSTLYIWNAGTKQKSIFRVAANKPNGNIISTDGFLLTCEAAPFRRIAKTDLVTKVTSSLVTTYNGQPLNAPNDMTAFKDGSIYFTDPTYNTPAGDIKQPVRGVYRVKMDGSISLIYGNLTQPNGLVFSPDYKYLYVNDSQSQIIKRLEINAQGNMITETNFASINGSGGNGYDGMAMDIAGNIYTGGNQAVNIYNPLGQLIQTFPIGENTTNMKFGGADKKTLFILSPTSVRKVQALIPGL
jgi:gluconolactonase